MNAIREFIYLAETEAKSDSSPHHHRHNEYNNDIHRPYKQQLQLPSHNLKIMIYMYNSTNNYKATVFRVVKTPGQVKIDKRGGMCVTLSTEALTGDELNNSLRTLWKSIIQEEMWQSKSGLGSVVTSVACCIRNASDEFRMMDIADCQDLGQDFDDVFRDCLKLLQVACSPAISIS